MNDLLRYVAGADRLLSFSAINDGNYPPHNLIRIDEATYIIEVAATGFSREDVNVQVVGDTLTVAAKKQKYAEESIPDYLHRGLSTRSFSRQFKIMDAEVKSATLKDGILSIRLVREHYVPEKIEIAVE